jgi:hypothetical protein
MRRITLAIATAATAGAVGLMTACGAAPQQLGGVKLAAAEAVEQSAQQAAAVSSYTVDAVADVTDQAGAKGKVEGRMVYQAKPELAVDLTLDTVSFGENQLPGGVRAIVVDETAYVKAEALNAVLGTGKPWLKASISDLDSGDQAHAKDALARIQQFDLAGAVKLVTASDDVKAVGTETVGGVDTTHYSGTFPVKEAIQLLDPAKRPSAEAQLGDMQNMKFDLWADAQSLPRKITMSGAADGGSFNATMQFKGFNEPVEINAPPAGEVGEIPAGRN